MAHYRSAQGKKVDMSALVARNEKVRAVGNMKVNARGDTIDSKGRIVEPVTSKVAKHYTGSVGSRTARPVTQKPQVPVQPPIEELLSDEFSSPEDIEIERMKAQERKGKK